MRVATFVLLESSDGWGELTSSDMSITIGVGERRLTLERVGIVEEAERKTIPEIDKDDAPLYELIGKAEGQSICHCLYLAFSYCEKFYEEVYAYSIEACRCPGLKVEMAFYGMEKKPS